MDPFSIGSLVGTCINITVRAGKLGTDLYTLIQKYKYVARDAEDLSTQVLAIEGVVSKIQCWLDESPPFDSEADTKLRSRLGQLLERCSNVLSRIDEITSTILTENEKPTFGRKAKYVWNEDSLKSSSDTLSKLSHALSLILQSLHL